QILGQRYVPPTNAALIMSVEAVFALLAGMIFLDESATIMALLGCFFILLGVTVAQLEGRLFKRH
ncbi:MAG: EamA family transporter, partial [Gammaproteobacteria bacterium]